MKNYLKISLLCVVSLTLHGSDRRNSDKVRSALSEPNFPAKKEAVPELSKSLPIPISRQREMYPEEFRAKSPSQGVSIGDYFALVFNQSYSPRSYHESSR